MRGRYRIVFRQEFSIAHAFVAGRMCSIPVDHCVVDMKPSHFMLALALGIIGWVIIIGIIAAVA